MRAFMKNNSVRKGGPDWQVICVVLLRRNQYIACKSYCTYNMGAGHYHKGGGISN